MTKPVGQKIWDGFSHLPPLSSTEFAVEDVIEAFSDYFQRQEQADWDDQTGVKVDMDSPLLNSVVKEEHIKSAAQLCISIAVGAVVQVVFSLSFAIWNGALGITKVVVALVTGHAATVDRQKAQDTLQHGLYMCMVAAADLVIAAALSTIVILVGYAIYVHFYSGSSIKEQSGKLFGDFIKPIRDDAGLTNASYLQGLAYRGMKLILS